MGTVGVLDADLVVAVVVRVKGDLGAARRIDTAHGAAELDEVQAIAGARIETVEAGIGVAAGSDQQASVHRTGGLSAGAAVREQEQPEAGGEKRETAASHAGPWIAPRRPGRDPSREG